MTFSSPAADQPQAEEPEDHAWVKMLENLVRILTGYAPMQFKPFYYLKKHGESEQNTPRRWRTILGLEEIQFLPEDLGDSDQRVSLGRAAHEVWHVLFSRPELIFDEPELVKSMAFQALWWAIEDPRVNWLGVRRHPGAREWLDAAMAKDYEIKDLNAEKKRWKEESPLHLQFNYALIYQWWSGRPDPRVTDPRVLDALSRVSDAIQRAISTSSARRSFGIIKDEIWPIYKQLVDEAYQDAQKQQEGEEGDSQDQDGSSQGSSGKPSKGGKGRRSVSKSVKERMEKAEQEFRDKHASKLVDKPEGMSEAEREKAKREMEELRRKMGQQDGQEGQEGEEGEASGQPSQAAGRGKRAKQSPEQQQAQRERLSRPDLREEPEAKDEAQYQDFFKRVRHLVPVMKSQFLQVLRRKIRRRVIRSRDSGDLDGEALSRIPGGRKDVFKESMIANKTLYRISLLIDISGSMNGEKKDRAIEGAIMMMESLDTIPGVAFEIVVFDDKPKVVKAYNEKLTPKLKVAVVKAILTKGGSTQSLLALEEAIERIRMGRGDRLMIMVNDGDPDNNFDRDHYRLVVRSAKDVEIHGVGVGEGAQLVLDLFPPGRGWWLKDAADFAKNLKAILKKKLLGR